jgi:TRAP-type transport system periplasmic protein
VSILINKAAWGKLSDAQRKVITDAAAMIEAEWPAIENKEVAEEIERQKQAGIQVIEFKGAEGQAYLAQAYEAAWAGIIKQSPEHGPKLREFFSKAK